MMRIKKIIQKLSRIQKIGCLIFILIFFLLTIITIPSLAKLKNRSTLNLESTWDGTIASSYRSGDGTKDNPYIISNGSELAYFSSQLSDNTYENAYFKLNNDIVLNNGTFAYDVTNGVTYTINNNLYYVDLNTNNYYDNIEKKGSPLGKVNEFTSMDNFKGMFDGNSYIIYGVFISDADAQNLGLFKDLEGTIENVYVKNSVIYGGKKSGGIASYANNATIKNTVYDGFVVGDIKSLNSNSVMNNVIISTSTTPNIISVELPHPQIEGRILSTKLSGNYSVDNIENTTISINGTEISNGTFEIDLGSNTLDSLSITSFTNTGVSNIVLSELNYIIEYEDSISSGIVAESKNTHITNSINKSTVYGGYISSGLIGSVLNNTIIYQSYNTGKIVSNYISGGIIASIKNNESDTNITNSYNAGEINSNISGGIVGCLENNIGNINILNSFNSSNNYSIHTNINSNTIVTNSYNINNLSINSGVLSNNFISTTIDNLYDQSFILNHLLYNRFISFSDITNNPNNVWIYENNRLPILYIDDISNPIASINIGTNSWNNYSTELGSIKLNSVVSFSINNITELNKPKEVYYYISNSNTALSFEQLNKITKWLPYSKIVKINESGYYIVYAKVVDNNDNVTYINTDVLAVDLSGFKVNLIMGDRYWLKYKQNLDTVYVNTNKNINISATDDLLQINSIQYYISSTELSMTQLNSVSEWINYTTPIELGIRGKYVIYTKVVDSSNSITYANTDYIVYDGYDEQLTLGQNKTQYSTNNITNNSSLTLNFNSSVELKFNEGYKHSIISNILLPVNTSLTLIDHTNNKVYNYIINENDLNKYQSNNLSQINRFIYSFDLFTELGAESNINYEEKSNTIISNENYDIIIDFSETLYNENYEEVYFTLEILDQENNIIFETLNETIDNINIYSNVNNQSSEALVFISSSSELPQIMYNSNSQTIININSGINYKTINDSIILDSTFENKKLGLAIKVSDSNKNIVSKNKLKNMNFKYNNQEYYFESDNTLRINLNNDINNTSSIISIITSLEDTSLEDGTYYIDIYSYATYDGYYSNTLSKEYISIPLIVKSNIENTNYNFNITLPNDDKIINKSLDNHSVLFGLSPVEDNLNYSLIISLYKKKLLTAYDQTYEIIDLSDYISNSLIEVTNHKYLVPITSNTFELNLIPNKLSPNGYKYVFELMNGEQSLGKIEKYFIVK